MKSYKIEAWVDDGKQHNYMHPGADAPPAIFVSIDGESMAENYRTLFVDKTLGAIADISALQDLGGDREQLIDLEDAVWEKIHAGIVITQLREALTTAGCIAAEMGEDGSRFISEDGVDLDELCDMRGGRLLEVHANQRRYQFADGSGVLISENSWDMAMDPGCWCRRDDGHDSENCEILNDA